MDNNCQVKSVQVKKIAEIIREQREQKGLLLREVAAKVAIDQALLSKIERGERMPTKDQVIRFAKFYKIDEGDLLIAFLSDKLVYELLDEDVALKAMQVAEKKITYLIKLKNGKR